MSDWRDYERFVAKLMSDEAHHTTTVVPNARLQGRLSKVSRQIDVLIDSRYGDPAGKRVIVDAKRHERPLDVTQVEAFEGLMRDVGADRGILVCPNGHSRAALSRAQDAITIRLVSLADLDGLDLLSWDPCSDPSCKGLLLWDATPGFIVDGSWVITAIGKCDVCHHFNVWCWACGTRFALTDEDEHHCACEGPWFWLTAIEADTDSASEDLTAVYLLLVQSSGGHDVIDRRPIR